MHQYWYVNSKGSGQLYNNQISVSPLYSQPQTPKLGGINGLGISEGWSGHSYPAGWKSPGGLKGFDRMERPVNWTSPAGQMGSTAQEPSYGWTTPTEHESFTPHGHKGNSMMPVDYDDWEAKVQPANWPQLPEHPYFVPQGQPLGLAPSAGHTGFNPKKQPTLWAQPFNYAGMFAQGHPASWAPYQLVMRGSIPKNSLFLGHNRSIMQGCSHKDISPLCGRRPPILLVLAPVGSRRTGADR